MKNAKRTFTFTKNVEHKRGNSLACFGARTQSEEFQVQQMSTLEKKKKRGRTVAMTNELTH